ncbi:hypothetical protein ACWDLG_00030 [Nonomuraea sp. NPDC003727]
MAATAPTAVVGGTNAAGAGLSVMVAGGCNGADPAPTLARFQQEVREGRIHPFVGGMEPSARTGGSGAVRMTARGAGELHRARSARRHPVRPERRPETAVASM